MIIKYSERIESLQKKDISPSEITEYFFENIDSNKILNAFNFIEEKKTVIESLSFSKNHSGKFAGMVFSVKDVYAHKDKPLTCSSNILRKFASNYSAKIIKDIISEGGTIIGRTNCDEFAMGSTNESSVFGPVLNPYNINHVSGGSSGGAAVSVAKDMCDIAIGSDTGGSVRIPASFCNVFGFKPSYGAISRKGLVTFAPSFDTVGFLSKDMDLLNYVFKLLAKPDKNDHTSVEVENCNEINFSESNILLPENIFNLIKDSDINKEFCKLKSVGGVEVESIEYFNDAVKAYYILSLTQTASTLSRYDSIRYGNEFNENSFEDIVWKNRTTGFGSEIKNRIILGNYILLNRRNLIIKANNVRNKLSQIFKSVFDKYNFIILPASASTAPELGYIQNQTEMYKTDILTTLANLLELPAISVPFGFSKNKLPFGLQIISSKYSDKKLLNFSKYFCKNILKY